MLNAWITRIMTPFVVCYQLEFVTDLLHTQWFASLLINIDAATYYLLSNRKWKKKNLYFTTKDPGAPDANIAAVKCIICCIWYCCKISQLLWKWSCYWLHGTRYRKNLIFISLFAWIRFHSIGNRKITTESGGKIITFLLQCNLMSI